MCSKPPRSDRRRPPARGRATIRRPAAARADRPARRRSPASAARRPTAALRCAAAQFGKPRKKLVDQILAVASTAIADGENGAVRFSATVRLGNTLSRSGTSAMPRRVISFGGRFSIRLPLNVMLPSVTRASSRPRKPEIARNVVVLPAPLVPSMATICPLLDRQVMPCTAVMARW